MGDDSPQSAPAPVRARSTSGSPSPLTTPIRGALGASPTRASPSSGLNKASPIKMPYLPISHRKESKGHGFAMAPRGFADFALPPSLIPALATAEAPLPDRMRLWPPGQSSAPVACVVDRPPGGARLDDIERIKAASKHVNKQRAPGAKPHSIHTQLMQWNVEAHVGTPDGVLPSQRADVFKLEGWLRGQLGAAADAATELEERATREAAALQWSLEEHSDGTNWALQGHAWREWLRCMLAFQEVYAQAHRELVRQVATGCVERGMLLEAVGRGSTELLNLAWNAFLRAATTADHLRTKAAGVSAQRAEQEAKPSELHRLQAEVTILRGELERSESRGTMLTQQLETARTEKKSKAHAVRLQSEQKTDGKAEDVPDTPNKGTPKPKAKAEEEASVDEGQTEAEELLAETKAELKRSEEAFERSQISEEAAWQEKQQLERTMQAYTPRPTHTKEEPVKTIILKAGQPTADRVAALEAELLRQNQQLQQLTADLDYHKALVASNDNQDFIWDQAFKRLADVDGEARPYFLGFGEDRHIPKFLRSKDPNIPNFKLSKRDIELQIKDIWKAKKEADVKAARHKDRGEAKKDLRHFLAEFLETTHQDQAVTEAYNLMWGCKRYDYDADVELFINVIQDEVHEDVYHDQMKLMDDVLFLLRALDDKTNSRVLGAVTAADFEGMMRDYFHAKPEDQIMEMLATAEQDLLMKAPTQWEQKVVAYELLFEEDENLDQGPFAECVRDQHLKSRTAFVEEVRRALMAELDGVVGPVTLRQTIDAFKIVDPEMKAKLVNEYLCRGFAVTIKELTEKMGNETEPLATPIGMFIKRLKAGVIAQKSRSDKGGKGDKKGGKKGGGMVRRNSFVMAQQALAKHSGEVQSDDEEDSKAPKKGAKKGK